MDNFYKPDIFFLSFTQAGSSCNPTSSLNHKGIKFTKEEWLKVAHTPPHIPTRLKIIYALPGLILAVVGLPLYVYIPKFYTDVVGVSATALGTLILVARLIDAVSDPLVGVLSDHTRTRFGRRRPYIALGSILLAGLLAALYIPPQGSQTMLTLWFGTGLILLSLAWTLVDVPWESLGPEITFTYDERTSLFSFREGMVIAGTILAAASPLLIEQALSLTGSDLDQRRKFAVFALIYMPIILGCCWLCVWGVKERVAPVISTPRSGQEKSGKTGSELRNWKQTVSNRPFVILLAAYAVAAIGANLPATLIVYYVEYVLGGTRAEIFILLYVLSGILCLPFWLWVSRNLDKKKAWIGAMAVNTGAFAGVFLLGPGQLTAYALLTVASGTGFGASLALPPAMQADVIDYDEFLYGERREGRFIGIWSVVKKASSALGLGLALPLLDFFGYQPGQEQSQQVNLALRVLYCLVPCLCNFAAIVIALAYPLNRQSHESILQGIEQRRLGRAVPDPLRPQIIIHSNPGE
jgi:GPH family glycoside/pentoside/hexuronide:cation symporter